MVGPPSEGLNCFGAMKLWILWPMVEHPTVRVGFVPVPVALGRLVGRPGNSFLVARIETHT